MLEMLAAKIAQVVAKNTADGLSGLPEKRSAGRTQRLAAYAALQHSVVRAELRVDTLFAVHSAQYNVANVPAWVTGYPLVVGILNQLTDDLAQVVADWQQVRHVAPPGVEDAAESLLLALCAILNCVDPGWLRPRSRARNRMTLESRKQGLLAATTEFDRQVRADAAPRKKDRRAALASVDTGMESHSGPRKARSAARRPGAGGAGVLIP